MSLGYLGYCKQVYKDSEKIVYSYTCENWNNPLNKKMDINNLEGKFEISLQVFNYPYIITIEKVINKTKKIKTFRKIDNNMSIENLVKITTKHSSDESGRIALRLFDKIIYNFINTGTITTEEQFIV